jgi:hypothetical protein
LFSEAIVGQRLDGERALERPLEAETLAERLDAHLGELDR